MVFETNTIYFFAAIWFVSSILDYVEFSYTWQLKEYLWYRFRDFLTTRQGRKYWRIFPLVPRFILLVLGSFVSLFDQKASLIFITSILLLGIIRSVYLAYKRKLKLPQPTKNTLVIIFLTFFAESAATVAAFNFGKISIIPLLFATRFLLLSAIILALNIPRKIIALIKLNRAAKIISAAPHLKVIAITGSYGKTSVKDFLTQILSSRYRVLKIPENMNTDESISRFLKTVDLQAYDILVVEIGAYRRGHIRLVAKALAPTIGILTAVNEQHVSLFGSIENTRDAKAELLESLPASGLAIVNGDISYCREILPRLSCRTKTFGQDAATKPSCQIVTAEQVGKDLHVRGIIDGDNFDFTAELTGTHLAMNLAPCLLAAKELGINFKDIQESIKNLIPPRRSLRALKYGKSIILDDTYSSNPKGFSAALEVLKSLSAVDKKIVITRGMIELGKQHDELHELLGEQIGAIADEVVLISQDPFAAIEKGIRKNARQVKVEFVDDPVDLLQKIRVYKDKNCAILLENRLPTNVKKEIETAQNYEA